jgi:hypothetical protein
MHFLMYGYSKRQSVVMFHAISETLPLYEQYENSDNKTIDGQ